MNPITYFSRVCFIGWIWLRDAAQASTSWRRKWPVSVRFTIPRSFQAGQRVQILQKQRRVPGLLPFPRAPQPGHGSADLPSAERPQVRVLWSHWRRRPHQKLLPSGQKRGEEVASNDAQGRTTHFLFQYTSQWEEANSKSMREQLMIKSQSCFRRQKGNQTELCEEEESSADFSH